MANIKIEIETDSGISKSAGKIQTLTTTTVSQVGLLSSIVLSTPTITAFKNTLGANPPTQAELGYKPRGILTGRDTLQNPPNNCAVLATAGGLITCNVLRADAHTVPFVSLVGHVPQGGLGNCKGGVTLESHKLNIMRKEFLANHGCANIILFTNPNSAMHPDEGTDWGTLGFVESYAGLGGNNTASNLTFDFNGGGGHTAQIPTAANTGIIVSDDPFFGANDTRAILINLINGWIGTDNTKYVVYPSQIYASAIDSTGATVTPKTGQGLLLGPDMVQAYALLGVLANYVVNNNNANVGFFPVGIKRTRL